MNKLPLIYSCSGCSNLAQTANQVALELNREHLAEMSCIAGVGGNVKKLVNVAKSGRTIVALDGCALHCVKACLATQGIEPSFHHTLTDLGLKKRYNLSADPQDIMTVKSLVIKALNPDPNLAKK